MDSVWKKNLFEFASLGLNQGGKKWIEMVNRIEIKKSLIKKKMFFCRNKKARSRRMKKWEMFFSRKSKELSLLTRV